MNMLPREIAAIVEDNRNDYEIKVTKEIKKLNKELGVERCNELTIPSLIQIAHPLWDSSCPYLFLENLKAALVNWAEQEDPNSSYETLETLISPLSLRVLDWYLDAIDEVAV